MSPRSWRPMVKRLDPGAQPGSWVPEGPPLGQDPQASVFGWGRGRGSDCPRRPARTCNPARDAPNAAPRTSPKRPPERHAPEARPREVGGGPRSARPPPFPLTPARLRGHSLFFRRPLWGCGGSEWDPPGQTSPSHSAPHLGPAAGAGRDPLLPAPSARPETPARRPGPAHPSCSALCGALDSFLKLRGCPRDNPPLVPNLGNWPLSPRSLEGRGAASGDERRLAAVPTTHGDGTRPDF